MILLLAAAAFLQSHSQAQTAVPTPPAPNEIESYQTMYGRTWNDPYAWMRKLPDDPLSPELDGVIRAENDYTEAMFAPRAALEKQILGEIRQRKGTKKNEAAPDAPVVRVGQRLYDYDAESHTIEMQLDTRAIPMLTVDVAWLGGKSVARFLPSPHFERTALLVGNEILIVEGLGKTTALKARIVVQDPEDVQWAWDEKGKHLLYVDPINDLKNRQVQSWSSTEAKVFYESPDPRTYVLLSETRDQLYVRVQVTGYHLEYPVFYNRSLKEVWRGENAPGAFTHAESEGDSWIVKATRGGRFFEVFRMVKTGAPARPRDDQRILKGSEELDYAPMRNLDEQPSGLDCFEKFCALGRRNQGKYELEIVDTKGTQIDVLQFPEPHFVLKTDAIDPATSEQFDFVYQSFLKPATEYRYKLGEKGFVANHPQSAGGFQSSDYVMEQRRFKVWDGSEVPVTFIRHRKTEYKSETPMYVQVYGTYGTDFYVGYDVAFNLAHAASLLDRGVVFAFVHARGGGELGHHWYLDGNGANKYNTVRDFRSVLEMLIDQEMTSAAHLAIGGFSAGGNAIGNALTTFPQLFKAALIQQGFLDLIGSSIHPEIPFTQLEWSIWGDPQDEISFNRMWKMDPYQNLLKQNYPAVFVRTSMDDHTVLVHEAVKFVSKLRRKRTNWNVPTYLQVLSAGIGGHDGRDKEYEIDVARNFVFLLDQIATPAASR